MLLSFYGQHAFGDTHRLVVALKPEIGRSDKYLKTCRLGDLIELLAQLGEHAQKEADRQQPFWQEFLNVVFIRHDLIAQLQQVCHETFSRLKLTNRAAYKIEEALEIGTQVIPGLIRHLLVSRDDYRASFPLVIALKTSRRYEDGRTRIDYLDEMGQWGFVRKDIGFRWRSDYYFRLRPGKSPIILSVEDWHQDFILRRDRPIQTQLDDTDLHTLFGKFEGCRKGLERQARSITIVRAPLGAASPLESIGFANDGSIFDRDRLLAAIRGGESVMVEFKATCRDPGRNDEVDRGKIAEEMCALANTKGGILVFGIPDKDKPRDIERAQAMRQELEPSTEQQRQKGDEWGPKYILDVIAGVAKGSGRDARACWPSVQYTPHLLNANDVGLEGGAVLVLAVFPMGPDDLCLVNQQVYVRVGTHCQLADNPWIYEWHRTKKKRWL